MNLFPTGSTLFRWSSVALLVVVFLLLHYPGFHSLTEYWAANDMYSYGFLVPLISGYLIWLRRHHLQAIPMSPNFGQGLLILAAGLLMLTIARLTSTNLLEWLSFPLTVCGVCVLVLGRAMTQA